LANPNARCRKPLGDATEIMPPAGPRSTSSTDADLGVPQVPLANSPVLICSRR
jgi:hypothetical protein